MPAIYGVILLIAGCSAVPNGPTALACYDWHGEVPCADTGSAEAPGKVVDPVNVPGGLNL